MNEGKVKINIIRSFKDAQGFYLLAMFTLASFMLYLFFIGQTVFRLVSVKNLESSKSAISTEIAELELKNLSLNDTISIEKAYELGFVSAKTTQYASAGPLVTLR